MKKKPPVRAVIDTNLFISGLFAEKGYTLNKAMIMLFPKQLAVIRKKRGYTQQALADKIGIHVTQIKRYEAGAAQPTLEVFRNIVLALLMMGTPYQIIDRGRSVWFDITKVRMARAVAPGMPHHVIQRGNRRQETFFSDEDYQAYLELMAEWCRKLQVEIWAYCLMPNHVHLVAVPGKKESLQLAIGEAHRRYTRRINFREEWRGHLWQGRFASFIMDERYLLACARYLELNPVRAGLVKKPQQWHWSSAGPHLKGQSDILVKSGPLLKMVTKPWKNFLSTNVQPGEIELLQKHERTGRPLGTDSFIEKMEHLLDRELKPKKPGPKFKDK